MKHTLTAVVLLLLGSVVPASAQRLYAAPQTPAPVGNPYEPSLPGCALCGVSAWLDLPSTSVTIARADLRAGLLAFQGWGFERVSGAHVDRVDLWVELTDPHTGQTIWQSLPQPDGSLSVGYYRPDVAAYALANGWANDYGSEWVLYVSNVPDWALGARRWKVIPWYGAYHADPSSPGLIRTLNITP
jgi:hypothetical protein